jgi:hypothetical protein
MQYEEIQARENRPKKGVKKAVRVCLKKIVAKHVWKVRAKLWARKYLRSRK